MLSGTALSQSLLPDGEGGHWMKVEKKLQGKAKPGDAVELEIAPMAVEPEPEVIVFSRPMVPKATTWSFGFHQTESRWPRLW
jgi:hypothetical protein